MIKLYGLELLKGREICRNLPLSLSFLAPAGELGAKLLGRYRLNESESSDSFLLGRTNITIDRGATRYVACCARNSTNLDPQFC